MQSAEEKISLYPFLLSASEYVRSTGITLDELINSAAFERSRIRGKERVLEAIRRGVVTRKKAVFDHDLVELLSYPFARILVSCIKDGFLIRRYVLGEAKGAYKQILEDIKNGLSDSIMELMNEFDISLKVPPEEHEGLKIHFSDYLRWTRDIHGRKWMLVNRELDRGFVRIKEEELARLLQEAIKERIGENLPLEVPEDICKKVEKYTAEIKEELKKCRKKEDAYVLKASKVVKDSFPPCISRIMSNLSEGISISHYARFAVASFLLNIGVDAEEVINAFRNMSDFDEERTRYQVMHIGGTKSSKKYSPPSCKTMRTYGLCIEEEGGGCSEISHPLEYYRRELTRGKK